MPTMTPDKMLRSMFADLVARRPTIEHASAYYDGLHNLAFAGQKFREAFGGLFGAFSDNWCQIVVDATEERMTVNGFRVGKELKPDAKAKAIWEDNDLDIQSQMGHSSGLVEGAFYVTVWPRGEGADSTKPEITVESAAGSIVRCHPKIRRRREAALRTYIDDDGYEHAELMFPDVVYLFRSRAKRAGFVDPLRAQWVIEDQVDARRYLDASGSMPNPLGVVPMVEFLNRPRLRVARGVGWAAHSELTPIIPLQDAVNKFVSDMLVASEFGAFPQRWMTGYEPDEDEHGKPIPPDFKSGAGKLWWTEDGEARFGQFDPTNLGGYVEAVELLVQHIASISKTPAHYLRASADRLSGESMKSSETPLIAKVKRKMSHRAAGWEEVMRLAGMVANIKELAKATAMETVWADPETRTESEHVDALQKKQALNVPDMQIWEELGYTSEQVNRFPAMRAQVDIVGMAQRVQGERDRQAIAATAERDAMIQTGATNAPVV